jgi:hypothetical protein
LHPSTPTLWAIRPRPLPNESFGSWFLRLAHGNGLTPSELYRVAVPGAYLHGSDLDRTACIDLLKELERRTGLPIERQRELTFGHWCGSVFDEDDGRNKLTWLPPAGRERSRKSYGQQFCPHCLAEDNVPYLRAMWRLGFVSTCAHHGTMLADRCPGCSEPIQPLKLTHSPKGFACGKCGCFLTKATPSPADPEDVLFQTLLCKTAAEGWIDLPGWGPLHVLAFFQLVNVLFRLVSTGPHARALRHHLSSSLEERYATAQIPVVKEVELIPPERRVQLLRLVGRLLKAWPADFVAACEHVGAGQHHLVKDAAAVPFVFLEPVTSFLSSSPRRVTSAEMREGADILRRNGETPTYAALTGLFNVKAVEAQRQAVPATSHDPYGKGRYWKLDGVSPEVREAVRKMAHREGENVAGWVEKALRSQLGLAHDQGA